MKATNEERNIQHQELSRPSTAFSGWVERRREEFG
jgi:hypothetical protein